MRLDNIVSNKVKVKSIYGDFMGIHYDYKSTKSAKLTNLALGLGPKLSISWLGFALLLLVWISTAAFQVPQHHILSSGFDRSAHRRLVNSNWARTVLWTARGIVSVLLLLGA